MIFRGKRNTLIWLFLVFLFMVLTFFSGWVIKFYRDYQSLPSHHLIGNKDSNVKALKEEGFPFSFLVIGDTQGSERLGILIKKALKDERFSFMIHLGDFVEKPDIWEHRFFLTEMITGIRPPFPVFVVPGNHDIDYTSKILKERRVTKEVFDSLYGARYFDFIFNRCLFILSEVDPKNPDSYLNYLRKVLSEKGTDKKNIFIFIHYPPGRLDKSLESSLPKEDEFFSLLETNKVTGCFFGHFHGYWRGEHNGIKFFVVGGGGRIKKSQPEWGRFHHILKIKVGEQMINENLIVLKDSFWFEDSFQHWVFTQLFPKLHGQIWLIYLSTGLFLFLVIFCSIFLILSLLKYKKTGK